MILNCDNLSFSVGADDILKGVTFSLNEGDSLGIVGVNGAGKSTLLKLIRRELQPTGGSVSIKKGAEIAMLRQNDAVSSANTPYEEMLTAFSQLTKTEQRLALLGEEMRSGSEQAQKEYHILHEQFMQSGGYEYKSRARGVLKSLGFKEDETRTCAMMSGGQKTRLALAKILLASPDILLLDEPTNHLDLGTLSWLEDYLRAFKKTLLVVSHDRYFLDRVTNKTLDVERGEAKLYSGGYSVYIQKKKTDKEIYARHYKNQQREIKRIEEYIALQRKWNRERNIIAAESRQKMLDKMEKLDRPQSEPTPVRMTFKAGLESGDDVLTVKDLSKSYGSVKVFSNVSFEVKKRDRLFMIGHNGCGKSTLLKIVRGILSADSGDCAYGYHLTIGYYDQENQNLNDANTVLDELWNTNVSLTQTEVRSALALFRFTGDDVAKSVSVLSGGERARLTFAKLILRENNLLLLDEPTNHLDIPSKEVLEEALTEYNGTMICVSHDRYFISKLATAILDFDGPDGKPIWYKGSYEQYLRFREKNRTDSREEAEREDDALSENKKTYLENKKAQSEKRRLRSRYEKVLKESEQIEERLAQIAESERAHESDYQLLNELHNEREALEERLMALYEEAEQLKELTDTE